MNRLAIIPARGGSKRIPQKNSKLFCGKPMISWSIEAAIESHCFDRIIVSTDDSDIADIAKYYGAEVPFMRPRELADDYTATRPVVNHAIEQATNLWGKPKYVCCIYATAPFLTSTDIQQAFEKLQKTTASFVFSAGRFSYPIYRGLSVDESGRVSRIWPEFKNTRSQDLSDVYHDAGQFYWGMTDAFLNYMDPLSSDGAAHGLPATRVRDIDTQDDWDISELLFKALADK